MNRCHHDQKRLSYIKNTKKGHRVFQKIIEDLGLINLKGNKYEILPL